METCGNVCTTEDFEKFKLQCFYCTMEIELSEWRKFVLHVRQVHSNNYVYSNSISSAELDNIKAENYLSNEANDFICVEETNEVANYANADCVDEQVMLDSQNDGAILRETMKDEIEGTDSQNDEVILMETIKDEIEETDYILQPSEEYIQNSQLDNWKIGREEINEMTENLEIKDDELMRFKMQYEESIILNKDNFSEEFYLPRHQFQPTFYCRSMRTIHFIELYKLHPCLWDPKHIEYKNGKACTKAYSDLIASLEEKINVILTENLLKKSIKKLHSLFFKVHKLLQQKNPNTTKINSTILKHYNKCIFLKAAEEFVEKDPTLIIEEGQMKLNFSEENYVTTEFINIYFIFPQLYDPLHQDYEDINARKEALAAFTTKFSEIVANISEEDVYNALLKLRKWYYTKSKLNPDSIFLTKGEIHYLNKCKFLPGTAIRPQIPCKTCNKIFYGDYSFQIHMCKIHNTGEFPYKCTECNRRFEKQSDRAIHNRRAHLAKTKLCSFCGKAFAVKADLILHVRTHTGEKPFVCESCGKAFRSKFQLDYHNTAMHTKIRAYECDRCPKSFFKRRNLVDHLKSHLNIRDKTCVHCGKGFTNVHSLIRHRKIHIKSNESQKNQYT